MSRYLTLQKMYKLIENVIFDPMKMPSQFWIYALYMDGYNGVMEMIYPIGKLLPFDQLF